MSPVLETNRKPISLRRIVITGVGLAIALPAILFGSWMLKVHLDEERAFLLDTLTTQYVDILAQAAANPLWNVDQKGVANLTDALMRNPDVVLVRVEETHGGIFAEQMPPGASKDTPMNVARRLIVYNGEPIGTATVGTSIEAVDARLAKDLLGASITLVLQVLLSLALVFFVLNRRLIRPIESLKKDAVRLARGELDEPMVWQRNDEIGLLAGGLDSMRQDLRDLIGEIDRKNKALETELADRTAAEGALRDTEAMFKTLFNASPVAIAVARRDSDYVFSEVNDSWVQQFGISRDEAIGKTGAQLKLWSNPDDRHRVFEQVDATGKVGGYDAWLKRRHDNAPFLCRITGRTVLFGEQDLLLLSLQDITAEHRHEQEMLELNSLLEQRVQERTEALSKSNQDLRAAVKNFEHAHAELVQREKLAALGALVADITDELNIPINDSLAAASTLHDQARPLTDAPTDTPLTHLAASARTTADVVTGNLTEALELITIFKRVAFDQTSGRRRAFDLAEVIDETLAAHGPGIRKSGHSVSNAVPAEIAMDSYPGALSQVVGSLIDNALMHAFADKPQGEIRIACVPREGDTIELSISDDGCGIGHENIDRIFNPFFSTRLRNGGSGLGLSIVHNLVTATLGGQIRAESAPGVGTRLILILPRIAPRPGAD